MKKVRSLLILLLAALMLTVFVGCDNNKGLDQLPPEGDEAVTPVDPKTFAGFKEVVIDSLPALPMEKEPLQYNTLTAEEQVAFIADAESAGYEVQFKEITNGILFLVNKDSWQVQQQLDGRWYYDDFNFAKLAEIIDSTVDGAYDLPVHPQYKYTPESYRETFIAAAAAHNPAWKAEFLYSGLKLTIDNDITFQQTRTGWDIDDTTYSNKVERFNGVDFTVLGSELFADMTDLELKTLEKKSNWTNIVIDKDAKTFTANLSLDKIIKQDANGEWTTEQIAVDPEMAKINLIMTKVYISGNDKVVALTNVSGKELPLKGYHMLQTNKRKDADVIEIPQDAVLGIGKTLYMINSFGTDDIKNSFDCVKNADANGDLVAVANWDLCTSKGGDTNLALNDGVKTYDSFKMTEGENTVVNFVKYNYYTRAYNEDASVQNWTRTAIANNDTAKAEAKKAFSEFNYLSADLKAEV